MSSRLFTCSLPECGRPAVRGVGGCDICSRYLCVAHFAAPLHDCSQDFDDATYKSLIVAEIDRLRSQINDDAVCRHVSRLTNGKTCKIEHSTHVGAGALMGCANYHARVLFDDGSPSWLLRVPRVTSCAVGLPVSLAEYLILSEYGTLKFLETTLVPAPKVFSYGIPARGNDDGIGVCFLLMEHLPGTSWTGQGTDDEKAKIQSGLAAILSELHKHPFSICGSLVPTPSGGVSVSFVASDRFVMLDPEGPFTTSADYFTAFAEQHLRLIADGQLYPAYPVEAYLVYRFLKENVHQLVDKNISKNPNRAGEQEQFFLKHVDDKGDHILVDEKLNITGIIDWQMARVVPPCEAFGPSLVTADMNALCNGKVCLSTEDVSLANALQRCGSPDLAAWMADDEQTRRFFWGLAHEPDWKFALPLANAILSVFGEQKGWLDWKTAALLRYSEDGRLRRIMDAQI